MSDKDDFLDSLSGSKRRGVDKDQHEAAPQETVNEPTARDDLLGGLITDKRQKTAPSKAQADSPGQGITPLDLLTLPGDQRRLVNWLSRAKQATVAELEQGLKKDKATVERLLGELVNSGYINQALVNDTLQYRVVFRGQIRRGPVGLPREIWARVDLDHVTFLKQISLFSGLSDEEIRDIANNLTEHRYQKDEVIIWQGNVSEYVYFIKSGIVGITRFSARNKDRKVLGYLKQGDVLGEYIILPEQGGIASATATAMSAAHTLMFKRADFLNLLLRYPSVALELSRTLIQRLIATESHFSSAMGARLVLLIGVGSETGVTTLGNIMAAMLAKATQKRTVYTEQPDPHRLLPVFNVAPGTEIYHHPSGYEAMLVSGSSGLPVTVRATMVLEQLVNQYENLVIGVPYWAEEIINYLIGYANQIVFVCTPDQEAQERLTPLSNSIKTLIHLEKVSLFYVLNRTKAEFQDVEMPSRFDFDLPYVEEMAPLSTAPLDQIPQPMANFASALADRLGRTNQVSIYIPTTIDVNQAVDTMPFVERTLAFLGGRFGGATTNQARGVWNSADAGLVGEDIHIIRSYATQSDLDQYMQEILEYVEGLKQELRQEAMALEINQKLMLI